MNPWKIIPLAKVVLMFLIGLFLSVELNFSLGKSSLPLSLGILISMFSFKLFKKSQNSLRVLGGLWMLLFLIIGVWRGELHRTNIHDNWLDQVTIENSEGFVIKLNGELTEKKNSFKSEAKIIGIIKNDSIIEHHEKTICYFNKALNLEELKKIDVLFTTRKPNIIQSPKNPGEFNYKKYLSGLGIQTQFYVDSSSLIKTLIKTNLGFLDYFIAIKNSCLETLRDIGIHDEAFGVIAALVFGEKDFLDQDTYRSYGAAGATHVLAVSGLHVGLIYLILLKLCSPFKRIKFGKYITLVIGLGGLWFYAAITGFSPSVLRASTMFSAILIGKLLMKKTSIYNTLAASALLLLFISPNFLMEVGFQLSYSAVLGILLIQPWLYKLWTPNSWLMDKAWQLSTVSVAAQLGTFPLGMLYFHQFPNYFLLSNLIVIPAATFILYLTLISLALSFSTIISKFLGYILQNTVEYLNYFIARIQGLPYAISDGIDITILECFMLYTILILSFRTIIHERFKSLKYALLILVVFFALQCQEKYAQANQCFIMVHSIKKERVISVIEGTSASLLASDKFLSDADKIKFHISHFWNKIGIENIEKISIENSYTDLGHFKMLNGNLFFKELQIETKGGNHVNSTCSHAFINKSTDKFPEKALIIQDGKTWISKEIQINKEILNVKEGALSLD